MIQLARIYARNPLVRFHETSAMASDLFARLIIPMIFFLSGWLGYTFLLPPVPLHLSMTDAEWDNMSAIRSIHVFGEAIGMDSSCHHFGQRRGICVVRCPSPFRCHDALALCNRLKPRCTGISFNQQGSYATLKAHLRWATADDAWVVHRSLHHQPWWRMSECRRLVRRHRHLVAVLTQRDVLNQGGGFKFAQSAVAAGSQALAEWNAALCGQYTRGGMLGKLRRGSRIASGHTNVTGNLVLNIGVGDGSDTAMFLRRRFRVVAIEANAEMIERAHQQPVIGLALSGRAGSLLVFENVAIAAQPGRLTLYSPEGSPQLASSRSSVCSVARRCNPMAVVSTTCSELMTRHGVPLILRVGVEGVGTACLESFRHWKALPVFVTVRDHAALHLLVRLGYTAFKLVQASSPSECNVADAPRASSGVSSVEDERQVKAAEHVDLPNGIGGMPWECSNAVGTPADPWSSAEQLERSGKLNVDIKYDLYAWRRPARTA